jgi:hypothetical protein
LVRVTAANGPDAAGVIFVEENGGGPGVRFAQ